MEQHLYKYHLYFLHSIYNNVCQDLFLVSIKINCFILTCTHYFAFNCNLVLNIDIEKSCENINYKF